MTSVSFKKKIPQRLPNMLCFTNQTRSSDGATRHQSRDQTAHRNVQPLPISSFNLFPFFPALPAILETCRRNGLTLLSPWIMHMICLALCNIPLLQGNCYSEDANYPIGTQISLSIWRVWKALTQILFSLNADQLTVEQVSSAEVMCFGHRFKQKILECMWSMPVLKGCH